MFDRSKIRNWLGVVASIGAFVCAESLGVARAGDAPIRPLPPADWFHVVRLDDRTYELSEPKYWQGNVSYLLLGRRAAFLFDTGPGLYSIRSVVQTLTHLPLIVIPSHLHFDHVGDLAEFSDVRLLDTPPLREELHNGELVETPNQLLLKSGIRYRVAGWIKDGESIDFGERTVTLLSTPGHTPDSVSILDAGGKRLFTGDLIGHGVTLVDVPGSDLHEMSGTLHRLLRIAPNAELAYEAHSEKPFTRTELQQFAAGVDEIASGRAQWKSSCLGGVAMKQFIVAGYPVLLSAVPGQDLQPLNSSTETLDWLGSACTR